jgi:hypothetical protein
MRLRGLIFLATGVTDAGQREALTAAWRDRGLLESAARRGYAAPEAAKGSRRTMLAWVLLTMAQDEPNFFALGALAVLTLPVFALLTLASVLLRRG